MENNHVINREINFLHAETDFLLLTVLLTPEQDQRKVANDKTAH